MSCAHAGPTGTRPPLAPPAVAPQPSSAPPAAWAPAAPSMQPPAATTVQAATSGQPYPSAQQPAAAAGRSAETQRTSPSEQTTKAPELIGAVPGAAQVAPFQAAVTPPLRTADMEPSSAASQLPAVAAAKAAPAVSSAALPASVSAAPAGLPASTAASVHMTDVTSAAPSVMAAAAAADSDAQDSLSNPSLLPLSAPASQQLRMQAAQVSANPSQASSQPPAGPPSQSSSKTAAQDPSTSPGQTPAGTPQGRLPPSPAAVPAVEPEVAQSGALPSAYANLPGKAALSKSKSMQPRSVAMGASKISLKVIRPQIPGMTKASSPSIAGASTLIGEARRHLGPTAQRAQHSMPADSLPPSSSAGAAAAMSSGLSDAAPGQNSTALATMADQPLSAAHVMHSNTTHLTPPTTTPGQPRHSPIPSRASDRPQREASTLSKGRPDGTGAAAIGSSPRPIGRADGSTARSVSGLNGKRESPKRQEAVPERSQSQAAEASRGKKEVYNRARDRYEYYDLLPLFDPPSPLPSPFRTLSLA